VLGLPTDMAEVSEADPLAAGCAPHSARYTKGSRDIDCRPRSPRVLKIRPAVGCH
jgi:hypothetical protein